MSEIILGIDLGTTNSEVAVIRDGRPQLLEVDGSRMLPSVVGLSDDNTLLVGEAARNQYALYPERTVKSIKRLMGGTDRVALGTKHYSPQEVSALILGRLKAAAEQQLGMPLSKAVITVPAYFSDAQRQATRDAGELAGLEVVRIINEPTAAALAYESGHKGSKQLLVYDLGGGTFDVSVVRIEQDVVEVLASHGNNHLGGDDFDQKITEHVLNHLREERGVNPEGERQAMARIVRAAEAAKITLSDHPFAKLEEEYLLEHKGAPLHLSLEIARADYETLIEAYLDETIEAVHTALQGSGLTVAQLDEILLVGGATRTPAVQRRLEQELGLQPRAEVDPDLCVATGAALQAAAISGQQVASILVDVTPYTFGTSAVAELNGEPYPFTYVPLIRKNTPIPVTKSEIFYTSYDGQETVEVKVYQGEDPDALNNTEIGNFLVEGLGRLPSGNPLIATFSLDLDGILQVRAREKETGLEKGITIDNATARFAGEEMEQARARLDELIGQDQPAPEALESQRGHTQAQALVEKAERLLDEASADDREDLINLIEAVQDALARGEDEALNRATEELSDLIFYLAS